MKRKINSLRVYFTTKHNGIYYATNANVKLANAESAFSAYIWDMIIQFRAGMNMTRLRSSVFYSPNHVSASVYANARDLRDIKTYFRWEFLSWERRHYFAIWLQILYISCHFSTRKKGGYLLYGRSTCIFPHELDAPQRLKNIIVDARRRETSYIHIWYISHIHFHSQTLFSYRISLDINLTAFSFLKHMKKKIVNHNITVLESAIFNGPTR